MSTPIRGGRAGGGAGEARCVVATAAAAERGHACGWGERGYSGGCGVLLAAARREIPVPRAALPRCDVCLAVLLMCVACDVE